tara:strand:+ start:388 stop:1407 length:1020 start_codon:yes stop_codon:yes gene_type:complete
MDFNPFRGRATQDMVQEKSMDPVSKDALKGKHKDRKDKDIDNDGDVDSSDKYLHKRRKAISKAMKSEETGEETVEGYYKDKEIKAQDKASGAKPVPMPKKEMKYKKTKNSEAKGGGKEGDVEMNPKIEKEGVKESRIRSVLKSVLSEKKANHSPNAAEAEKMSDKIKGQGAKDMMKGAEDEIAKGPEAHLDEPAMINKDAAKMTSNVPKGKARSNDNMKGDTKIKPGGTPVKNPGAMKNEAILNAYASMYVEEAEEDIQEAEQLDELSPEKLHKAADQQSKRTTRIGALASKMAAAGRNSDKADKMYDKSKARQDRLRKGANAAGDRDAEKAYQASKRK